MIVSKPDVMVGKPVIEGTRITVESILEKLASGRSFDDILTAYPRLEQQDIYDALSFAAQALQVTSVYPTPPDERARSCLRCAFTRTKVLTILSFKTLRAQGYEVSAVVETEPSINDTEVLRRAHELEAILITIDKDFGELVYRHHLATQGVILLRLEHLGSSDKAAVLLAVLKQYGTELEGAFTVIGSQSVRVRPLGA